VQWVRGNQADFDLILSAVVQKGKAHIGRGSVPDCDDPGGAIGRRGLQR